MKRIAFVVGLVMVLHGVLVGARTPAPPSQDALTMLRAALGGDAALGAVQTIRARGKIDFIPHDDHFEIALALPDRFVKTLRTFRRSSPGWRMTSAYLRGFWTPGQDPPVVGHEDTRTTVTGFNREKPIPAPTPYEIEENPGYAAPRLDGARARLAEFLLPLMGWTPASYPVVARSEAYAITFSAVGGREWRLELDEATHLPARMTWTYPLPPTAPATAKPRRVQTDYGDFRVVGGMRWPHRIITQTDGRPSEDATIDRYEINVKLSDKMFRKYTHISIELRQSPVLAAGQRNGAITETPEKTAPISPQVRHGP